MTRVPPVLAPLPPTASGANEEPASPCVGVCRMNLQTRWCEGCWRSIDEIATWSSLDAQAKQSVLNALHGRRDRLSHPTESPESRRRSQ